MLAAVISSFRRHHRAPAAGPAPLHDKSQNERGAIPTISTTNPSQTDKRGNDIVPKSPREWGAGKRLKGKGANNSPPEAKQKKKDRRGDETAAHGATTRATKASQPPPGGTTTGADALLHPAEATRRLEHLVLHNYVLFPSSGKKFGAEKIPGRRALQHGPYTTPTRDPTEEGALLNEMAYYLTCGANLQTRCTFPKNFPAILEAAAREAASTPIHHTSSTPTRRWSFHAAGRATRVQRFQASHKASTSADTLKRGYMPSAHKKQLSIPLFLSPTRTKKIFKAKRTRCVAVDWCRSPTGAFTVSLSLPRWPRRRGPPTTIFLASTSTLFHWCVSPPRGSDGELGTPVAEEDRRTLHTPPPPVKQFHRWGLSFWKRWWSCDTAAPEKMDSSKAPPPPTSRTTSGANFSSPPLRRATRSTGATENPALPIPPSPSRSVVPARQYFLSSLLQHPSSASRCSILHMLLCCGSVGAVRTCLLHPATPALDWTAEGWGRGSLLHTVCCLPREDPTDSSGGGVRYRYTSEDPEALNNNDLGDVPVMQGNRAILTPDAITRELLDVVLFRLETHLSDVVNWTQVDLAGRDVVGAAAAHQMLSTIWPLLVQRVPYYADKVLPFYTLPAHTPVWRCDWEALNPADDLPLGYRANAMGPCAGRQQGTPELTEDQKCLNVEEVKWIDGDAWTALLCRLAWLECPEVTVNASLLNFYVRAGADVLQVDPVREWPLLHWWMWSGAVECVRACLKTHHSLKFDSWRGKEEEDHGVPGVDPAALPFLRQPQELEEEPRDLPLLVAHQQPQQPVQGEAFVRHRRADMEGEAAAPPLYEGEDEEREIQNERIADAHPPWDPFEEANPDGGEGADVPHAGGHRPNPLPIDMPLSYVCVACCIPERVGTLFALLVQRLQAGCRCGGVGHQPSLFDDHERSFGLLVPTTVETMTLPYSWDKRRDGRYRAPVKKNNNEEGKEREVHRAGAPRSGVWCGTVQGARLAPCATRETAYTMDSMRWLHRDATGMCFFSWAAECKKLSIVWPLLEDSGLFTVERPPTLQKCMDAEGPNEEPGLAKGSTRPPCLSCSRPCSSSRHVRIHHKIPINGTVYQSDWSRMPRTSTPLFDLRHGIVYDTWTFTWMLFLLSPVWLALVFVAHDMLRVWEVYLSVAVTCWGGGNDGCCCFFLFTLTVSIRIVSTLMGYEILQSTGFKPHFAFFFCFVFFFSAPSIHFRAAESFSFSLELTFSIIFLIRSIIFIS
eukprot:gene7696-5398_t